MKTIERKHFYDLAKRLAYYTLVLLSEIKNKEIVDNDPSYLTNLVISRLSDMHYDDKLIHEWLSSESLRKSVLSVFIENLKD